jgi:hypothetical protein
MVGSFQYPFKLTFSSSRSWVPPPCHSSTMRRTSDVPVFEYLRHSIRSFFILSSLHSPFYPHSILFPSGTTLDYTLDQLFVHLDDPSLAMQTAVLKVILVASKIDPGLVVKKAGQCRLSQRTPEFCDKILYEIQGYEILPDEK